MSFVSDTLAQLLGRNGATYHAIGIDIIVPRPHVSDDDLLVMAKRALQDGAVLCNEDVADELAAGDTWDYFDLDTVEPTDA